MSPATDPKPLCDDPSVEVELRDALRAERELDVGYDLDTGWDRFTTTLGERPQSIAVVTRPTSDVVRLGRYVLHREIGAGGMATVHLGRIDGAAGFGRTIAVKRLKAHLANDRDFVAMFVDEARLAGRIR